MAPHINPLVLITMSFSSCELVTPLIHWDLSSLFAVYQRKTEQDKFVVSVTKCIPSALHHNAEAEEVMESHCEDPSRRGTQIEQGDVQ